MKLTYILPLLVLLGACNKHEDATVGIRANPPFACDHVVSTINGVLDASNRQDIAAPIDVTAYPHDSALVYLCKAGTSCEALAGINYSLSPNLVTILDGNQIHLSQGFDSYSIVATQCR